MRVKCHLLKVSLCHNLYQILNLFLHPQSWIYDNNIIKIEQIFNTVLQWVNIHHKFDP